MAKVFGKFFKKYLFITKRCLNLLKIKQIMENLQQNQNESNNLMRSGYKSNYSPLSLVMRELENDFCNTFCRGTTQLDIPYLEFMAHREIRMIESVKKTN
jgi:hypothetical protein